MSTAVPEGLLEHAGIDKELRALLEGFEESATSDVGALFQSFAERVRDHLTREEREIAKYAEVDAVDAKALLEEHAGFRATLQLLTATAGRPVKGDIVDLKLRLMIHEAHEETGLYRWAKTTGLARPST